MLTHVQTQNIVQALCHKQSVSLYHQKRLWTVSQPLTALPPRLTGSSLLIAAYTLVRYSPRRSSLCDQDGAKPPLGKLRHKRNTPSIRLL